MTAIRKTNAFILTLLLLCAGLGIGTDYILKARAGVACTLPFTLSNGTIADATQVMANYNALVTCLGNAAAAGVNSDINTLAGLTTPLTVAQGGTGRNTQTTDGVAYYTGTVINTDRCSMNSNQSIFCTSSNSNQPNHITQNTAADASPSFYSFRKSRSGGNSLSSDFLGLVSFNGFANGGYQESGRMLCQQNGAVAGSLVPTKCSVITSVATNLDVNFSFPPSQGISGQSLVTDGFGNGTWGRPAVDVQVFTATGANTWTRPTGATYVRAIVCGAGGGGGGGGRAAAATSATGGAGGGGGYCADISYKAADAGASQTVTIGTGGTNGAGASVNGNAGTNGAVGGNTTFGALFTAYGGGGGQGGPGASGQAGGGGGGSINVAGGVGAAGQGGDSGYGQSVQPGPSITNNSCAGGSGPTTTTITLRGAAGCPFGGAGGSWASSSAANIVTVNAAGGHATAHGPGGGGGGSVFTDNTARAGGSGGGSNGCPTPSAGGAAGNNPGGSTASSFNYLPGCGGGGGGSATVTGGGAGGAGTSAGGGGGGGAGDNVNAGNGGAGGNGFAVIVSW